MARLVRDEAGMHADERQHENRQRTHGNTRTGQQRRVGGRIARQDERAVSSGARGGRAETSRTGELRNQHAVQALAVLYIPGNSRHASLPHSCDAWPSIWPAAMVAGPDIRIAYRLV